MSSTMKQGEEFYIGWRFKSPTDFSLEDLTGFNILIQLRASPNATSVIDSFTHNSPEVIYYPQYGAIDLHLPASKTANYNFKKAYIDCWALKQDGSVGDRSTMSLITLKTGVSR